MADAKLKTFTLVGGTALALYLGHRKSDDIDLFCSNAFDAQSLKAHLERSYQSAKISYEENTVNAFIDMIKVDLMTHAYPLLQADNEIQGLRLASLADIAAMKLNAVSGRGFRKDFLDIAELLQVFTMEQMISYFSKKYAQADSWHLMRSLCYFEDADHDDTPITYYRSRTWEEVKMLIMDAMTPFLIH